MEKLAYYHEKTGNRWGEAFHNLMNAKEFGNGMEHADALAFIMGLRSQRKKISPVKSMFELSQKVCEAQIDALMKHGVIYINEKGGWHFSNEKEEQFIIRKELVFPDYKEENIRIKRFPYGNHYYAYIGDMQVKDGDIVKWNTRDEAYNYAKRYLS